MSQPTPPNRLFLIIGLFFISIGYAHPQIGFSIGLGGFCFIIAIVLARASFKAYIFTDTLLGLTIGMVTGLVSGLVIPALTVPLTITLLDIVVGAVMGAIALPLLYAFSPLGMLVQIINVVRRMSGQDEVDLFSSWDNIVFMITGIMAFLGAVAGIFILSPALIALFEPVGGEILVMGLIGMLIGTEWGAYRDKPRASSRVGRLLRFVRGLNSMKTLPSSEVVEPFSKINYWPLRWGGKRLRVYLLMERPIEGAQTGLAIDGSASMQGPFGQLFEGKASPQDLEYYKQRNMVRFAEQDGQLYQIWTHEALKDLISRGIFRYTDNLVEPQARDMTAYLSQFDADGGTTVIYWATGDGRQLEIIGDLRAEQCPHFSFKGPRELGQATYLLPAIQYFVERFVTTRWGIYIFITDGRLDDLEEVKSYCTDLAHQIARKERNDLKLVLIGVGDKIDEEQLEELDNLETGTNIDLWDYKIAQDMKHLAEIFAEVVSESIIMVPNEGVIRDEAGHIIKDYRDTGLPALLLFDLPPHCSAFTLEVAGQVIYQRVA